MTPSLKLRSPVIHDAPVLVPLLAELGYAVPEATVRANIANLAIIGSIMIRHGHAGHFWGLILPHGILELTAVFIAGGVGLRLFWSWVEPGALTRAQSLAREGRTAGTIALGLIAVLFVSGMI